MKKTISIVIAIVLVLLMGASPVLAGTDNGSAYAHQTKALKVNDYAPDQILVNFKQNVGPSEMALVHRQCGGQVKETIPSLGVQVVNIPQGKAAEKVKAYSANPMVAYAEPDYQCQVIGSPDDDYFSMQWGLSKIEAAQAWDVTRGSRNINIAILDTGVDSDHPDLAGKVITNVKFSSSPTTDDLHGHGTHVAGIAAAGTNNGMGVAGVGCDSTIMNVKVLHDTGSGFYSWVATGIVWAADNGAEIINLSLGATASSITLENTIKYAVSKGVVVVAAAGNNGDSVPFYPACYDDCIAVAATDANDNLPYWSNYGDYVDVAAPGVSILSTLKDGGYGYMSGTSMAAPHVSGLAGLLYAISSDSNGNGRINDEVRQRIESTAENIGVAGIGSGRINASKAVGGTSQPTGQITGKVVTTTDGSPISGAIVSDGSRSSVSDIYGNYALTNLPEGGYSLTAHKEGFQTSSTYVSVTGGQSTMADFSLTSIESPSEDIWADGIYFNLSGNGLCTEVGVAGDTGPVSGANVEMMLTCDDGKSWSFSGLTGLDGKVIFRLNKAAEGGYVATINNLTCEGYSWDKTQGIDSASYSLSGNSRGKSKK